MYVKIINNKMQMLVLSKFFSSYDEGKAFVNNGNYGVFVNGISRRKAEAVSNGQITAVFIPDNTSDLLRMQPVKPDKFFYYQEFTKQYELVHNATPIIFDAMPMIPCFVFSPEPFMHVVCNHITGVELGNAHIRAFSKFKKEAISIAETIVKMPDYPLRVLSFIERNCISPAYY